LVRQSRTAQHRNAVTTSTCERLGYVVGVIRGPGHYITFMADLLAIRKRLIQEAGRWELAVDPENGDWTDAGANQVIDDATEWLNSLRSDLQIVLSAESFVLLVADTDTNYWSDEKPHLLVNAARRMLEVRHRNTAGKNDWDAAIIDEVHQIYANAIKVDIDADIAVDAQKRVMQG